MKKMIILLLLFISLGCTNTEIDSFSNTINESIDNMVQEPSYVDTNPIKVGLYQNGKLVHDMNINYQDRTDIAVFNIVYSNEEDLGSTNLKDNWNKYYKQYENIDDYKIGFYIELEENGKKYDNLLLNPSNQHKLDPYLYLYLYDGIHQTGRYSHLTMKDIKDDTIYTTIKLYMHLNSKDVTSPITISVFTYKDDNDFLDGKYRGNSIYTVKMNKKN